MKNVLEICVENLQSAKTAQVGGANRIELCSHLSEGGLTPGYALVADCIKEIQIPIYVMIRPRAGNFIYSNSEILKMLDQIHTISVLGIQGFVLGCLTESHDIDVMNLKRLKSAANPKPITFHRAFDDTRNPLESMNLLIQLKIEKVLTSGQSRNAIEGIGILKSLAAVAQNDISIIAGGGILPTNIDKLLDIGIHEFHSSARSAYSEEYEVNLQVVEDLKAIIS